MWNQACDPVANQALSTLLTALPIIVLLGSLGFRRIPAHCAAQGYAILTCA